jgi:hypothetical protein
MSWLVPARRLAQLHSAHSHGIRFGFGFDVAGLALQLEIAFDRGSGHGKGFDYTNVKTNFPLHCRLIAQFFDQCKIAPQTQP